MKKKLEDNERQETRAKRSRRRLAAPNERNSIPGSMASHAADTLRSNITAEDCVWLGEDGNLNPDELFKERGFEPEGALRLILGAIIDAHAVSHGPSRSKRIDSAESALLGTSQRRGKDPHDDEDLLRELGRRYHEQWFNDQDDEIEVGPIARDVLADAKAAGRIPKGIVGGDIRRLQRKFVDDRDRILARATAELRWNSPEFYDRILRILFELNALGVACDTRLILRRLGF